MRREVLEQLLRAVVLATDLGSGEARVLYLFGDGAGMEPALLSAAREAAERDQSRKVEGPDAGLFLRVSNPPVRVLIVGAVHVAQSLARMVRLAGYEVLVVDLRRPFATEERFRDVPIAREWPDEVVAHMGLDRRAAVITMTHDPKIDEPALAAFTPVGPVPSRHGCVLLPFDALGEALARAKG